MNIDTEYNEIIKKIVEKSPCSYSTVLKHGKRFRYLYDYIISVTAEFPADIVFPARIYYVLNNLNEPVKCKVCGKDIPHDRKCHAIDGYASLCCSPSCAQLDPDYRRGVEERNIERYGKKYRQMTDEYKSDMKKRLAELSREHWETANRKRKTHNNELYGCDSVSQLDSVKEKVSLAWKNKSESEIAERTAKSKATRLAVYGDENYNNTEKSKQTVKNNAASDPDYYSNICARRMATVSERYGVSCITDIPGVKEKYRTAKYVKSYNDAISGKSHVSPNFDADYYAAHRFDKLSWTCNECGNEFTAKIGDQMYYPARCPVCHPLHDPASGPETEFLDFVKSVYNEEIFENTRSLIKPNEIDIYLPDRKLAFEFDGLYWHSEDMGTGRNYHLSKTERCAERGVRLIHILESEWKCKTDIVKSRVKNILGFYDTTVYARKCDVREVSAAESKKFQIANHIQGFAPSSVHLGLFFEDTLISLMTFGKCRFDRKHEWELVRFCCRLGYHIPGGAGKLLKYFERNYEPRSIVTYADRRWSAGGLYYGIGFRFDHMSKPDYWYWNHSRGAYQPESRLKYQKHKLSGLLKNFDPLKSEYENMKANGYFRIYDCGNMVFEKIYDRGK